MKTNITFAIDTDKICDYTDEHLAKLWYIAQANQAPIEDKKAGILAEAIGREIIKRWLKETPTPLWDHQGAHHAQCLLADHGQYVNGVWTPKHLIELHVESANG